MLQCLCRARVGGCEPYKSTRSYGVVIIIDSTMSSNASLHCDLCPVEPGQNRRPFKSAKTLRQHQANCHDPGNLVTCDECGEVLKQKNLARHKQLKHPRGKREYGTCDKCQRRMLKSSLARHVHVSCADDSSDLDLTCPMCDKVFKKKGTFAYHCSHFRCTNKDYKVVHDPRGPGISRRRDADVEDREMDDSDELDSTREMSPSELDELDEE